MKLTLKHVVSRLGLVDADGWKRIHRQVGIITLVLPAAVLGVVIDEVLSYPEQQPMAVVEGEKYGLADEDRVRYFAMFSQHEGHWRTEVKKQFPGHAWSQTDAYFNHIMQHLKHLSRLYKLHTSQLFMVFDEGVHNRWPDKEGNPVPATTEPLRPRKK